MTCKLKIPKFKGGFTLIETLLAVLILTSAIAGPLSIASHGLTASLTAKDQITAFYLAQDAMEQVRFVRDSNCLAAGGSSGCPVGTWLSGLGNCAGSTGCYFDTLRPDITPPTACGSVCPVLNFDSSLGAYRYASGVSTPQQFIRTVTIQNGATPDEAVVTVKVSWVDIAGVTHPPITIRENMFRWQ